MKLDFNKKKLISFNALISLTAMMMLLLILFQVSASSIQLFQNDKNKQIMTEKRLKKEDKRELKDSNFVLEKKQNYIISSASMSDYQAITEGFYSLKESFKVINTIEELPETLGYIHRIILCKDSYSESDIKRLKELVLEGINIIFANLPEAYLSMPSMQELIGVYSINKSVNTDGFRILGDFMIGGRSDYKKSPIKNIPQLKLLGSTKTYLCGLYKEYEKKDIKNEALPPIVWRNRFGNGYVFVFLKDFMKEKSNMGMFISAIANMEDEFVYPIVNARTFIVKNFPYLSFENESKMQELYSMSSRRFLEDNILPDLVAITEKTGDVISSTMNVSFDKRKERKEREEDKNDILESFQSVFLKQKGEMGLDFYDRTNINKKIQSNLQFMKKNTNMKIPFINGCDLTEAQILEIKFKQKEIGTVVQKWNQVSKEAIGFLENDLVKIPITSEGYAYSDLQNLRLKNAINGMGLSNHAIDIKEVVYPEKKNENWRYQSVELGKNLDTYWKPFEMFDTISISEEGKRIRQYLLLDYYYKVNKEENKIDIYSSNLYEQGYFILRTKKEIKTISGGSFEQIEEGAYLLKIQKEHVIIDFIDEKVLNG